MMWGYPHCKETTILILIVKASPFVFHQSVVKPVRPEQRGQRLSPKQQGEWLAMVSNHRSDCFLMITFMVKAEMMVSNDDWLIVTHHFDGHSAIHDSLWWLIMMIEVGLSATCTFKVSPYFTLSVSFQFLWPKKLRNSTVNLGISRFLLN